MVWLTSEDEWYKAAYYDAVSDVYYDYPAGTDAQTVCATPTATPNRANCYPAAGDLTNAGSYTGSPSPNGTFDQGGNIWELNEAVPDTGSRGLRGGTFAHDPRALSATIRDNTDGEGNYLVGFRVASVPEPGSGWLLATGIVGLAAYRRRRG